MVQITIPSALLQSYSLKCNHIYDTHVKALTKICGLNNPSYFKECLLTSLSKQALRNNDQINTFLKLVSPHAIGNKFVLDLFNSINKTTDLINKMDFIQKYQNLMNTHQLVRENKIEGNAFLFTDSALFNPSSSFNQKAFQIQEELQHPEIFDEINYNELIAQAIENFLKNLKEKKLEDLKKEKEKIYEDLMKNATYADDDEFEDESGEFNWEKFRKEVIWAALDKISQQKTMGDIGFSFGFALFNIPFNLLRNVQLQLADIKKQREKKTKENRNKFINETLKKHALNRDKLAIQIVEDAQLWILDRPSLQGSKLFPTNQNGHFDFKRFSKRQLNKYLKLIKKYSKTTECETKLDCLTGIHLTKEERESFLKAAIKKAFKVKPGSSKQLTPKELIEKLTEIKNKQPNPTQQITVETKSLPAISDEISKLIDKIDKSHPLSKNEMKLLELGLLNSGGTQSFVSAILSFPKNQKAIPPYLKNDIFSILALKQTKNPSIVSLALKNQISIQQLAKYTLQEYQKVAFIEKWKNNVPFQTMQPTHQRAS